MNYRIKCQITSLDNLFKTIEVIKDDEIQAHCARYLCIKTSGLFENYMKSLIGDYVDSSSAKPAAKYVKGTIRTFTNINYNKLENFLNSFDESWCEKLRSGLNDKMKISLDSVISNRNNIAHGNPDSITFRVMKDYYENIKDIIMLIDTIVRK